MVQEAAGLLIQQAIRNLARVQRDTSYRSFVEASAILDHLRSVSLVYHLPALLPPERPLRSRGRNEQNSNSSNRIGYR